MVKMRSWAEDQPGKLGHDTFVKETYRYRYMMLFIDFVYNILLYSSICIYIYIIATWHKKCTKVHVPLAYINLKSRLGKTYVKVMPHGERVTGKEIK